MYSITIQFESWVQKKIDTWWQAQQDKESLITALCWKTLLSTLVIIIYNIKILILFVKVKI